MTKLNSTQSSNKDNPFVLPTEVDNIRFQDRVNDVVSYTNCLLTDFSLTEVIELFVFPSSTGSVPVSFFEPSPEIGGDHRVSPSVTQ